MVGSFAPTSLQEALLLLGEDPCLIPYAGGTDLMVDAKEGAKYLFLNKIPEMKRITEDGEVIRFGAACAFSDVIKNPLTPAILKEACLSIAAPAIRNAGTLGGNIGNGSPKADSALVFMVTDSKLRLASAGSERILPIKDFYLGRNKTALAPGELIVEILTPRRGIDNYYYKKVGARNALAISRVSFAGIVDIQEIESGHLDDDLNPVPPERKKHGVIKNCATAFGAVSDVIIRPAGIDSLLTGKCLDEVRENIETIIEAYSGAIVPVRGRVGMEYRKDVCMNLLRDFLELDWL